MNKFKIGDTVLITITRDKVQVVSLKAWEAATEEKRCSCRPTNSTYAVKDLQTGRVECFTKTQLHKHGQLA